MIVCMFVTAGISYNEGLVAIFRKPLLLAGAPPPPRRGKQEWRMVARDWIDAQLRGENKS